VKVLLLNLVRKLRTSIRFRLVVKLIFASSDRKFREVLAGILFAAEINPGAAHIAAYIINLGVAVFQAEQRDR